MDTGIQILVHLKQQQQQQHTSKDLCITLKKITFYYYDCENTLITKHNKPLINLEKTTQKHIKYVRLIDTETGTKNQSNRSASNNRVRT